jgi:hypothetical protein
MILLLACTAPDTADTGGTADTVTAGPLLLDAVLDLNATVATKGMDIADDGRVFVWNYNQDDLEVWDGADLTALVTEGLISSFGTDLVLDGQGGVVVSKGGSSTGEILQRWDDTTGAPLWGDEGLTIPGGLMLGLTRATVDGEAGLYAADGAAGLIRHLDITDGDERGSVPVAEVPLDVAVGPDGTHYVLTAAVSNPLTDGAPVTLRRVSPSGVEEASLAVDGGIYLALAEGLLYISATDFTAGTRRILTVDTDLTPRAVTELPASYSGYTGGIAVTGAGAERRIHVAAQEGTGSGPICDVLVYREE